MNFYTHDPNKKAVNLNALPEEAWRIVSGSDDTKQEAIKFYKSVAFAYRCIDIRAKAISSFPRDIMRGSQILDEEKDPIFSNLDTLLYQIETALCIYAYAYLMKQRSLVDLLGVRWLKPTSITPKFDSMEGLTHFERSLNKGEPSQRLDIDEVVHFWLPTIDAEVGPGTAPLSVVLANAETLNGISEYSRTFFERGAVFPILLTVEGNPPQAEMEKLESWWRRLIKGVSKAWESAAVRAGVEPKIIGPPVSDMAMPELTTVERENISTGLGVPHSIVLSNAANFATAHQDILNLYDLTVVPEMDLIAEVFNEQLFSQIGLELIPRPERLEPYQKRQLEEAKGVTDLVLANIITRDEARELAGYEPLGEVEQSSEDNELKQWRNDATSLIVKGQSPYCQPRGYVGFDTQLSVKAGLRKAKTMQDVLLLFDKAIKQNTFVPRGHNQPLLDIPSEQSITNQIQEDNDQTAAFDLWNELMPEFEGLLETEEIIGREQFGVESEL
jgi:phage portal protein BeeE